MIFCFEHYERKFTSRYRSGKNKIVKYKKT